jgi:hypothetical protein
MRYILLALVVVCSVASDSFASGLSTAEKGIIELEYIGRQVQSVENNLRLYYMAKIEDRPDVEPIEEVKQLKKIIQDLNAINLPNEISDLKPDLIAVINKLIDNCSGILKKDEKLRDKEFDDFWKAVSAFNEKLKAKIDKYLSIPQLGKDFNLTDEEAKLITDSKDQNNFRKAVSLVSEKKYEDAVNILKPLLARYRNKPAEGCIIVIIVDSYMAKDSPLSQRGMTDEYLIGLLIDFINRKQYAPQIQRIYLQWRTLEQSYNNGASNWSTIPNDQYNQVLKTIAGTIESHIDQFTNDRWAKFQLLLLMDTPIIERWGRGYQYGNTMALDYAFLNGMLNKN